MKFTDLVFVYIFLAELIPIYFIGRKTSYRNIILVAFSLIFYAWSSIEWLGLLLISITVNYFLGLMIDKYRGTGKGCFPLVVDTFHSRYGSRTGRSMGVPKKTPE